MQLCKLMATNLQYKQMQTHADSDKPFEKTYYIKDSNKQINTITEVTAEKDIGVHFDPKLNCKNM